MAVCRNIRHDVAKDNAEEGSQLSERFNHIREKAELKADSKG